MKKTKRLLGILFAALLVTLLLALFVVPASADEEGYYTYTVGKNSAGLQQATITDVDTSISGNVTIPATLGGYPVTAIGESAFAGCTALESITIPDSVTSIGNGAFSGCGKLTSITIPDSVTSIGSHAFYNCTALESIAIPESVTSIGMFAFSGCNRLIETEGNVSYVGKWAIGCSYTITSLSLREGTIGIGDMAFRNYNNLKSIDIPDSVKYIGTNAFSNCSLLESISLNGVVSVGANAFSECTALKSVTFGDNLTSISYGVFSGCTGIKDVYLSNIKAWCETEFVGYNSNPMFYAENVYLGGALLTDLVVPDGVTRIGLYAFYDCDTLKSVKLPNSVTYIGNYAFAYCRSLESINIPDSVTVIGQDAFYAASKVKEEEGGVSYVDKWVIGYTDSSANATVSLRENTAGIAGEVFSDRSNLRSITIPGSVKSIGVFRNCQNLASVVLGNGITSIDAHAFSGCIALESITIPDSVTSIGSSAFYDCKSLTGITIPDSVTSIGSSAFYNCKSLTGITIPDSVTSIGSSAFAGCWGLTSITIPDSVTSIGNDAFYGCEGLTSITIGKGVAEIGDCAFLYCLALESITVAKGNTAYHMAGNCLIETASKTLLLGFDNSVIPTDGSVASIGDYAFYNCTSLAGITIPDSVTSIGDYAFYNCTSLAGITIPDSVTSIGSSAFSNCTGLTGITIPDSVTSIGDYAFYNCTSLAGITIPDSVTSIGRFAFSGCTYLTGITIPDSVTSIGYSAFSNCTGLTDITIPDSVTSIGDYAFSGCTYLTDITIPDSVTSIGDHAFLNCSSLVIKCYKDSAAHVMALSKGIPCEFLLRPNTQTPLRPVLLTRTEHSIILTAISGYEYRLGDGAWQTSPVFEGLAFHTSYTFYQRIAATETHEASAAGAGAEISTKDHEYTAIRPEVAYLASEATCAKGTLYYYSCQECGVKGTVTFVYGDPDPSKHAITAHDAKPASCLGVGWEAYEFCTHCDYTTYVEIPALGHAVTHHDGKAPTCTDIGFYPYDECSRCNCTTYIEIPALGHGILQRGAKAPTCTEPGWNAYEFCTHCDYTTYVELPALGHDFTVEKHDATHHWKRCSCCEAIDGEEEHTGGTATCTERKICEDCGTAYGELGAHKYADAWSTTEAEHWYVCSCGAKADTAPHSYGDDNICDTCGYEKPNAGDTPADPGDDTTPGGTPADSGSNAGNGSGGCTSSLGASILPIMLALTLGTGFVTLRKKKEN